MKKIVPIILIVIVIIIAIFVIKSLFLNSTSSSTNVVVLTEDGFKPADIKIKKGDVVTFKTTAGKSFWPASDIHPTHGIYPEFDPKEAISATKTWSFKFDKVGKWNYHDHLAPYFTGKVEVE